MNHLCKINPCLVDTIDWTICFQARVSSSSECEIDSVRRSHSVTFTTATARVMVPLPISSSSLHARASPAVLTPSPGPGGSQDERAGAVARSRTVGLRHPDYRGRTPRPPADLSSSSFLLLSESLSFFVSRFVQGFFQIANSWWRNSGPQCTPKYECEVIYLNQTGYHY